MLSCSHYSWHGRARAWSKTLPASLVVLHMSPRLAPVRVHRAHFLLASFLLLGSTAGVAEAANGPVPWGPHPTVEAGWGM